MSNTTVRYWFARVGEPVPHHSPETGKFTQVIVECSDPAGDDDTIKEVIRTFVKFPAGFKMRWHEFGPIQIAKPKDPPSFIMENAHVKIWLIADKPGNIR